MNILSAKSALSALAILLLITFLLPACSHNGISNSPPSSIGSYEPISRSGEPDTPSHEPVAVSPSATEPSAAPSDEPDDASPSASPQESAPEQSVDETAEPSPSDGQADTWSDEPLDAEKSYPGLFVAGEPGPPKVAYITIDDGPSREITPSILDYLKEQNIKATFFVLPHEGLDDIYMRIIDEGHELGNHSYSHVYADLYKSKDLEAFRNDVLMARNFVYDNFGYTTTAFRFPGGAMGRRASIVNPRIEVLEELGYHWYDWSVSTGDADKGWAKKTAVELANNVLANTRGRDKLIVLMHDTRGKDNTLEALPLIIEGLRAQNYSFDLLQNYHPPESPADSPSTDSPLTDSPLTEE